jgi:prevent-host-death family protein
LAIELVEAETQLAKLIQDVESGAEIVITCNGKPVARLVPAEEALPDRVPGSAKGVFTVPDDFDAPLEEFRAYT